VEGPTVAVATVDAHAQCQVTAATDRTGVIIIYGTEEHRDVDGVIGEWREEVHLWGRAQAGAAKELVCVSVESARVPFDIPS